MRALCISLLGVGIAVADDFAPAGRINLKAPSVTESSGLAAASAPGMLWVINDSGGTPEIHLVGTDGSDHGRLQVKGTRNIDWEALASFRLDGKRYLLVADTGDNRSRRETSVLHIVEEPEMPKAGQPLDAAAMAAWRIEFRYPDGPRDCEAVAVDAEEEKIILITKRTDPPEVHQLPLRAPKKRGIQVTRKIGTTSVKPTAATLIPFSDQPTGLDLSPDGSLAAVVTYHGVFLFPRNAGESWAAAFSRNPEPLKPHRLVQAEAIAISNDLSRIHVLSEGRQAPIVSYQRRKFP